MSVNAKSRYSDETAAEAESMLGVGLQEITALNFIVFISAFDDLANRISNDFDKVCKFRVAISRDGSVITKTRMKQVEQAYIFTHHKNSGGVVLNVRLTQ